MQNSVDRPEPHSGTSFQISGDLDEGMKRMHSSLSVSGLCFPGLSALHELDAVANIGATHTTLPVGIVTQAGPAAVLAHGRDLGVDVPALIGGTGPFLDEAATWPAARGQLMRAVDVAAEVEAKVIYMLTGSRKASPWEEALERFSAFMAPCLEHAAAADVALAVEPANVLYADLTFVHSATAAFELARRTPEMMVCLDLFHTWTEPDLREHIMVSASLIGLVQVGDYVLGDRSLPARAVPGDGGIPIDDAIGWLWEAGYRGVVDLELSGPRIDREGHHRAARRGAKALDRMLARRQTPV
jgi:sugar phosphate isomerase/epimerase